jgi:hypothetical protein
LFDDGEAIKNTNWSYRLIALDPTPNCPASRVIDEQIVGDYNDEDKIRELGELSDSLTTVPLIVVIKPTSAQIDEKKYREILSLMNGFGIQVKEYDLPMDDIQDSKNVLKEMEDKGAMALIVIGSLTDESMTTFFLGFIAEHTDLATIGLPIAKGFAGKAGNRRRYFQEVVVF